MPDGSLPVYHTTYENILFLVFFLFGIVGRTKVNMDCAVSIAVVLCEVSGVRAIHLLHTNFSQLFICMRIPLPQTQLLLDR